MATILVLSAGEEGQRLIGQLAESGYSLLTASEAECASEMLDRDLDLVILDLPSFADASELWQLLSLVRESRQLPVILLLSGDRVQQYELSSNIDDFVLIPYSMGELLARVRRALWRTRGVGGEETIGCGDLIMDLANYDVFLAGKKIDLTFKEYQLLKFLVINKGRVFTREALLNSVWGFDYYGGDRTVDVHIRRLRSKIEDATHSFIETVRNVGYRFRES